VTTAIVIGATGLVGRALTDRLVDAETIKEIVTLTRRPAEHRSVKVHNHVVDFNQLEKSADLFKADLFFSCLGTTRKQAGSIAAQRKVDLDYQYEAARLAADQGVSHYLLVSSTGANASSNNPYQKMKGELEEKIKTLPFKRISIFQPSLLLGAREDVRVGEKFASWIFPALCSVPGLRRYRPITGEQVAAKMVQVCQQRGPLLEYIRLDDIFIR
jgi:uncharacterized protein YbjT (DUF2867 family)